ncbi:MULTISPECIES: hypothetical protein [unclassified Moraxella]|uniref:hypothetical protein n=1 Tax=unclassified Moraxella TaxID=2685852 RepID=UPI003AF8D13A
MGFQAIKGQLVAFTGLEKDALHIYVGMSIFLLTLWVLKRCQRQTGQLRFLWVAVLMVVGFAILGEVLDYQEVMQGGGKWHADWAIHDIINTSALPILMFLLIKFSNLLNNKQPN